MTPSRSHRTTPSLSVLALAAALSFFAGQATAASMTRAEMNASKAKIEADHKADLAACKQHSGNAKDICEEEAEGKENVAKAELQANFSGKAEDRRKVAEVKAKADYEVAEERCDDKAGNPKDVCKAEAKAAYEKAKADVKLSTDTGKASSDAMKAKDEAGYKVAAAKCDALAGDAKSSCMASAKTRYGMN